jgi:hypothetical protein
MFFNLPKISCNPNPVTLTGMTLPPLTGINIVVPTGASRYASPLLNNILKTGEHKHE